MSTPKNQSVIAEQQALLRRILASDAFHKSTRSRQILEYLSEKYFLGQSESVHEAQIGIELFGRGEDFDPSSDSIVRASMRHLRARLAEFYAGEGREEAWELQIPRGAYRLSFEPRSHPPVIEETAEQKTPAVRRLLPLSTRPRPGIFAVAMAAMAILSFFVGVWLRPAAPVVASAPEVRRDSIFEHFLDQTNGPVYFVPSDSVINLVQSFSKKDIALSEYQSRRAFALDHPAALRDPQHWRSLISRELLNIGDASLTLSAVRDYPAHAQRIMLRQSRDLQARDLRLGNYVFLGSVVANPWIEVFEPNLKFVCRRTADGGPHRFRNTEPDQGEGLWYPSESETLPSQRYSYAQIAALPNLSHSGRVLLIGGITQPDTEAAGEFALRRRSARTLSEALGTPNLKDVPGFEVILRTEQSGSTWRVTEVVAHRILHTKISYGRRAATPHR